MSCTEPRWWSVTLILPQTRRVQPDHAAWSVRGRAGPGRSRRGRSTRAARRGGTGRGRGCTNCATHSEPNARGWRPRRRASGRCRRAPALAAQLGRRRPRPASTAPSPANDRTQNGPISREHRTPAPLAPDPAPVELERRHGADRGGDDVGPRRGHGPGRDQHAEHGQADRRRDDRHRAVARRAGGRGSRQLTRRSRRRGVTGRNTQRRSRTKRTSVATPCSPPVSAEPTSGASTCTPATASTTSVEQCERKGQQREHESRAGSAAPARHVRGGRR